MLATTYLDEAERAASVLVLDAGTALAAGTPEEIVAAMPGSLRAVAARPAGEAAARSWRRAGRWRVWDPPGRRAARTAAGPAGPAGRGDRRRHLRAGAGRSVRRR